MKFMTALAASALAFSVALIPAGADAQQQVQPRKLRFQTSYPAGTPTYENLQYWASLVNSMSGGRLQIEAMPAGALVPAFEVVDAINKKVLDGGQSAAAYSVGKNSAATLFGPAPGGPFGMDSLDYIGWIYNGGGLELYQDFYKDQIQRNVVAFPMTYAGNQPLGWFKTPVKDWADLKGRKCRETGMTAEVFAPSGMTTVNIPGGEIVPSGERGVIDCAEFAGPFEDKAMGFQTVWKNYYLPSMHEPSTILELIVNGDVWKSLSPDLQQIMKTATMAATFESIVLANKRNAEALKELQTTDGVKVYRTPDDIMVNVLKAWDNVAKDQSEKNPYFKKVYDSQRAYAEKVVPVRMRVQVPYGFAAKHYWPEAIGAATDGAVSTSSN